ncbi:MAG: hypothetical protein WKG01_39330 [Kofleriaceae bacterium]
MARGSKSKSRPRPAVNKPGLPVARTLQEPTVRRVIDRTTRRQAVVEIVGGSVLLVGAVMYGALAVDQLTMNTGALAFGTTLLGLLGIAIGAWRLGPRSEPAARSDPRRWIYGVLGLAFALVYVLCLVYVMPNRLPGAALHLWCIPVFTFVMALGTLAGGRLGWWFGVLGGSGVLLATTFAIVRILASAAFLAGVYGAFGKAASTFAVVAVALMVEAVALVPICLIKWLMSRTGRRTYGVAR